MLARTVDHPYMLAMFKDLELTETEIRNLTTQRTPEQDRAHTPNPVPALALPGPAAS